MPDMGPLRGSYWVRPGKLLAGPYPGGWDEESSRQKLRSLLDAGVTFWVDLTESDEHGPYWSALETEAAALRSEVEHRRFPIPDMDVPFPQQMTSILDTIDDALAEGHTVYVHCMGGIGRTGTVIGCYLVRHGLSGEEALKEIARLRGGYVESPETSNQRRMVREWK